MKRAATLTVLHVIERVFKWQKGTYAVRETGRIVIIEFGKSQIRKRKLQDAVYDIQQDVRHLFQETFTTNYTPTSVEMWF